MGSRKAGFGKPETLAEAGADEAVSGCGGLVSSEEAGEDDGWVDSTILLARLAAGGRGEWNSTLFWLVRLQLNL